MVGYSRKMPPVASSPPFPGRERNGALGESPLAELVVNLGADPEMGLTASEAAQRLRRFGPNEPAPITRPGWYTVLLRQFINRLILLLIFATAVSLVLGESLNALAIGITVIVSGGFGFINEFRSERAIAALQALTALRAEVVRGGLHEEIAASEIVPGDVIAVAEGRAVPADARLIEARGLFVNESILTGEPIAVLKTEEPHTDVESATPATALYAGTTVVAGSGLALVVATGSATSLGSIFTAMRDVRRRSTPLEDRLESLGNRLILAFLAMCLAIVVVGLLQGRDLRVIIEMAVALAVGAIPEGLPAVATTTLAVAVRRLAGRKVLVRRLDAVETLGSTTVIATDKTGTLTENRMVIRQVLLADGRALGVGVTASGARIATGVVRGDGEPPSREEQASVERLLVVAALCSDAVVEHDDDRGWHAHGDPSEAAIAIAAAGLGNHTAVLEASFPRTHTRPFTSATRYMQTHHQDGAGESFVAIKGAFEQVRALTGGENPPLAASVQDLAGAGYRGLAVAEGAGDAGPALLGAIVLEDPLRPDAAAAVAACREAGIRVMLITGDQLQTAANVATQTGILSPEGLALTGSGAAGAQLARADVVARATHDTKEAIVAALQDGGEVVAMTGDGVNDAPALRAADVGVAVGPGATDVAMEAADVVLADGRLMSLVEGIKEGRLIARNLRQAIIYLLTASFGTIFLITLAMAAEDDLALGPLQILWLNLVVHIFPALALSTGREAGPGPTAPTTELFARTTWAEIGVRALAVAASGLVALVLTARTGETPGQAQAVVFTALALGLVGQAFFIDVRSLTAFRRRVMRPGLWLGAAISVSLMLMALQWPGFRAALELDAIGAREFGLALACAAASWFGAQALLALGRRLPVVSDI